MWSQLVRIEKQGSCSSEVFFFTFYPKTFFIVFISFCSHFELMVKVTWCWFSFYFQTIFQPWLHVEERVLDSDGYSTWKCLMGVLLHLKSTCPSDQHKNFWSKVWTYIMTTVKLFTIYILKTSLSAHFRAFVSHTEIWGNVWTWISQKLTKIKAWNLPHMWENTNKKTFETSIAEEANSELYIVEFHNTVK